MRTILPFAWKHLDAGSADTGWMDDREVELRAPGAWHDPVLQLGSLDRVHGREYDLAMVDDRYRTHVIDASPLIYLAKIDAMEVFEQLTLTVLVTPTVVEETTRPALLYRHEDAAVIEQALQGGAIEATDLGPGELGAADDLSARIPALHRGEREVLAVAAARHMPAVLFERRARHVAKMLGVQLMDTAELLFAGTPDDDQLEARIRHLARLTNMRLSDYDAFLDRVKRRRLR